MSKAIVKERPILFSAEMVRAILASRKTQTRRVIKSSIVDFHTLDFMHLDHDGSPWCAWFEKGRVQEWVNCPYGKVGDRLWVREAFVPCMGSGLRCSITEASYVCFRDGWQRYRDGQLHPWKLDAPPKWEGERFRPSIHMPRWASRITLEITGVRVERLNDISEEDAKAEGAGTLDRIELADIADPNKPYRCRFAWLWAKINGMDSWSANPWVWVIEFKRIDA